MIESLQSIQGPDFVWYFLAAGVIGYFVTANRAYADGSLDRQAPQMTRMDPYAVAVLRGGPEEAVKVAIFDLERQGAVTLEGEGQNIMLTQGPAPREANTISNAVYDFVSAHPEPFRLFTDDELSRKINMLAAPLNEDLRRLRLMRNEEDSFRALWAFIGTLALVEGAGLIKLFLGITNGKPVLFLAIMLLIFPFLFWIAASPNSATTALGHKYISDLQQHFRWVGEPVAKYRDVEDVNMAFAMAALGDGVFSGGAMSDLYHKAAKPPNKRGAYSDAGGGCGGGCGGGGAHGGGGCSGCGGGGCGGCGGGGCGG